MSEEKTIEMKLKDLVVERLFLNIDPSEIDEAANLPETYNVDSVGLFELVIGLEEVFGISLEEEEFQVETFSTIRSIAELVRKSLEKSA